MPCSAPSRRVINTAAGPAATKNHPTATCIICTTENTADRTVPATAACSANTTTTEPPTTPTSDSSWNPTAPSTSPTPTAPPKPPSPQSDNPGSPGQDEEVFAVNECCFRRPDVAR